MNHMMKISVIGDSIEDNKAFCEKFLGKMIGPSKIQTIGADFYLKEHIWDSKTFKFQSWLLHTSKRFQATNSTYIIGTFGAIIILDVTNPIGFVNIPKQVKLIWEQNGNGRIPIAIVGLNKSRNASYVKGNEDLNIIKDEILSQSFGRGYIVSEIEIPYNSEYSINVFYDNKLKNFGFQFCKKGTEFSFIEVNDDLTEDMAWEILNNSGIEFLSLSIIQDISLELVNLINKPKSHLSQVSNQNLNSNPILVRSGDIEEQCIEFCKKISEETKNLGFSVMYFSMVLTESSADIILDYLAKSALYKKISAKKS